MEKRRGELKLTIGYLYLRPKPPLWRGRLESKQESVDVLDDVVLLLKNLIDSNWGSDSCAVPPLTPPLLGVIQLLSLVPEPSAAALGLAEVSASPRWQQHQVFFILMNTDAGAAEKAQGFAQVS
jgi:hypothetical protein